MWRGGGMPKIIARSKSTMLIRTCTKGTANLQLASQRVESYFALWLLESGLTVQITSHKQATHANEQGKCQERSPLCSSAKWDYRWIQHDPRLDLETCNETFQKFKPSLL